MRKSHKKHKRVRHANKNSHIETRYNYGIVETVTERRDPGTFVALAETVDNGRGQSYVYLYPRDIAAPMMVLNGNEARTLYNVLQRHFETLGRST